MHQWGKVKWGLKTKELWSKFRKPSLYNKIIPKIKLSEINKQIQIFIKWTRKLYNKLYANELMIAENTIHSLSDVLKEYSIFWLSDNERKSIEGFITHKKVS